MQSHLEWTEGTGPYKTQQELVESISTLLRGGWRRPAIPAAESTLGSHPCVALSSAQVLPEWINRNLAGNALAADGDNPLNLVSHLRGSLQKSQTLAPT